MQAITEEQVSEGLLSRMLLFESVDPDPPLIDVIYEPPPDELVKKFARWEALKIEENQPPGAGNLEKRMVPCPRIIRATERAKEALNDFENDMRKLRLDIRKHDQDAGLYMRVRATALKLAMIRSCGIEFDTPEITEADAEWGIQITTYSTNLMARCVDRYASDNDTQSRVKKIREIIRKQKEVSKTGITQQTQQLTGSQRNDALATIIDSGEAIVEKRGRTTIYKWNK